MRLCKAPAILALMLLVSSCSAFPWLPAKKSTAQPAFPQKTEPIPKNAISLGMVVGLSGPLGDTAGQAVAGAEVAVAQINRDGGVKRRQVHLIVKDSRSDPSVAVSQVRSLIADDGVSAIIGPLTSLEAYAIATSIPNDALLLTYFANAQSLTIPTTHSTYQVGPSSYMVGRALALELSKEKHKRYFVLGVDDNDEKELASSFRESLKTLDSEAQFVGEFWQLPNSADYARAIEAAVGARPDAVFSTLRAEELVTFTRQARQVNFFQKVQFAGAYDVGALQELKSEAPSGVLAFSRAPFFAFSDVLSKKLVEGYLARSHAYPSDAAVLAFQAVTMWAQLASVSPSLQVADMIRYANGAEFEFLGGRKTVRSEDHQSALGTFVGQTEWNDNYGFMTYKAARYVPAEGTWTSLEDILAIKSRPAAVSLGIITDLAGELAATAKESVAAAETALDIVKKDWAASGRQVDLLTRDAEQNPAKAANIAEELILRYKASGIIGPVSNATAAGLTDVARRYPTPFVFHYGNSERLTTKLFRTNIAQVGPSTYMVGRLRAMDLATQKHSRYYLIGPRVGAALEESSAFKERLIQLRPDVKFLGESWLPVGTGDYTDVMNTILAAKPDIVYAELFGDDLVSFTLQARTAGFFDQVAFTAPYDVGVLQQLKSNMVPGIRAYSRAPFFAATSDTMNDFVRQYRAKTSLFPSDAAVLTYDAVKLWAYMAERSGFSSAAFYRVGGIEYPSPFGSRAVRAIDHQVEAGIFVGYTQWNAEYGFMTYKDLKYLSPENALRSEMEVQVLRSLP